MPNFDKKYQEPEEYAGTIFKLDEEFLFQVKMWNKTNYSFFMNGNEVMKRSVQLENGEPERLNSPEFIRFQVAVSFFLNFYYFYLKSNNHEQLTLYGLPRLTKEENE